jgi:hypothetical protein
MTNVSSNEGSSLQSWLNSVVTSEQIPVALARSSQCPFLDDFEFI